MEFHQQQHKKQVKTLVTMEGRFEHDPNPLSLKKHFDAFCTRLPSKMHVEEWS